VTPLLDRKAYEALFQAQIDKLRRLAFLFLHDRATAEDAVQETFTQGLALLHTYRGGARPDVWLYSIALNACRAAFRKARAREGHADTTRLDRGRGRGGSARGPLTSLIRRETATRLALALGYLTDLQREVFVLHYVEDLGYEAIAPMVGVSTVGARGLAHRAKRVLREKLPANFALPGDR
jgi:RNA polymerase sigma-70 factor, ECF subfamily